MEPDSQELFAMTRDDADPEPVHDAEIAEAAASRQRAEDLAALFKMISASPDARGDLVEDIRQQMQSGTYLSEEKLNLAIYRLLKNVLE